MQNTPESHGRHTSWVRATPGRQALHDELVYRWSTRQRKHAVWHGGALRALRQTISFQLHAKESTQVALQFSYTRSMASAVAVAHIQCSRCSCTRFMPGMQPQPKLCHLSTHRRGRFTVVASQASCHSCPRAKQGKRADGAVLAGKQSQGKAGRGASEA